MRSHDCAVSWPVSSVVEDIAYGAVGLFGFGPGLVRSDILSPTACHRLAQALSREDGARHLLHASA